MMDPDFIKEKTASIMKEWDHLIGKKIVSIDDVPELGEGQFYKENLPKGSRVLGPRSPCTMDYRFDRLNVAVDDSGKCESLSIC